MALKGFLPDRAERIDQHNKRTAEYILAQPDEYPEGCALQKWAALVLQRLELARKAREGVTE